MGAGVSGLRSPKCCLTAARGDADVAIPAAAVDPQMPTPSEHAARVTAIDQNLLVSCRPVLWQDGAVWHVSDVRHRVQARRRIGTVRSTARAQIDVVSNGAEQQQQQQPHRFQSGEHVTTIHGERGTLSTPVQLAKDGSVEQFLILWDHGSQSYSHTSELVNPSSPLTAENCWNASALNEFLRDAAATQRRQMRSDSKHYNAAAQRARTNTDDDVRVGVAGVEAWVRRSDEYNDMLALCDAIDERLLWGWGSSPLGSAADNRPDRPPLPLQATVFARDPIGLRKQALKTKPVRSSREECNVGNGELVGAFACAAQCVCAMRARGRVLPFFARVAGRRGECV
jgi:hypothetical protein